MRGRSWNLFPVAPSCALPSAGAPATVAIGVFLGSATFVAVLVPTVLNRVPAAVYWTILTLGGVGFRDTQASGDTQRILQSKARRLVAREIPSSRAARVRFAACARNVFSM